MLKYTLITLHLSVHELCGAYKPEQAGHYVVCLNPTVYNVGERLSISHTITLQYIVHISLKVTLCSWFTSVYNQQHEKSKNHQVYLVCCCVWSAPEKSPGRNTSSFCQLGLRMDDLVDSPLSVIISNTKSHKKCCWFHGGMHPDTRLQGFNKKLHSQSHTSNNRTRHRKSLGQQVSGVQMCVRFVVCSACC